MADLNDFTGWMEAHQSLRPLSHLSTLSIPVFALSHGSFVSGLLQSLSRPERLIPKAKQPSANMANLALQALKVILALHRPGPQPAYTPQERLVLRGVRLPVDDPAHPFLIHPALPEVVLFS
ncbi:hypothetical protein JRI60_43875 [Archangium violaceum]|uniref:hypothetical protein n=1 Tax=Archangium violaceum TaxID=83451 RepID=UPI0019522DFE|nr:hypothetical protein [Archangium violaceum]QRN95913.1 hypothetical protein JRI60_43875 [Archangium violaceum]